jgi:ribosomal protein S27AE
MKDELTRRSFLKAAGLAVAGITGSSVLSRSAWAQEQKPEEEPKEKAPEEEPKDPEDKDEPEDEPNDDDLFEEKDSEEEEETRACPQCGALMYRQGRTWTCENCGYSYVE